MKAVELAEHFMYGCIYHLYGRVCARGAFRGGDGLSSH